MIFELLQSIALAVNSETSKSDAGKLLRLLFEEGSTSRPVGS